MTKSSGARHGSLGCARFFAVLTTLLAFTFDTPAQDRGASAVHAEVQPPASRGNSFALVIGIDSYVTPWPRLSNAVKDAVAVADELVQRGFEVDLKRDLDASSLEGAIEEFIYERGQDPNSRLLIWFAGHGHTVEGEAYLVPTDAPSPAADAKFRRKAMSMRDFGKFMREARARHVLAIFDSCFSGGVFESTRAAASPAVDRALELPVRQMISSGQADQAVGDDGRFRRLFIDALRGEEPLADANRDGYLTGSELGMFLSDKVTTLTRNRQTPHFGKLRELGFDRGDFVFRIGPEDNAKDGSATAVAMTKPNLPAAAADQNDEDDEPSAVKPSIRQEFGLQGGETIVLREGRLVFSMIGTPFGARGDLVGVYVNGKRVPLSLGAVVTAHEDAAICFYTLIDLNSEENRAKFLEQCGSTDSESSATPALTVSLLPRPDISQSFSMSGGTSQVLDPGGVVFTMIKTPFGARRDLVGVTINGLRRPLAVGQRHELSSEDRDCTITATAIEHLKNEAEFLWSCQ